MTKLAIIEAALICAIATCDDKPKQPPALLSDEGLVELLMPPNHSPYVDERAMAHAEQVNDLLDEIEALEGEVEDLSEQLDEATQADEVVEAEEVEAEDDKVAEQDEQAEEAEVEKGEAQAEEAEAQPAQGQTMEATYYDSFCDTCGQWGGITATGHDISESIYVDGYRVIAVDPSVIPLNSTVKVTSPHETFKAKSLDTGGDIVGNRIDILVESDEEARRLGRHDVTVEVID